MSPATRTAVALAGAGPADVDAVLDVLAEAFAAHASRFRPTALRETRADVAGGLERWLVARDPSGTVLGVVKHWADPGEYTCCFLAVRPAHRRRGVGSALLDGVTARARAAGTPVVRVALRRSLTANVAFFTGHGFVWDAPFGTGAHDLYRLDLHPPGHPPNRGETR